MCFHALHVVKYELISNVVPNLALAAEEGEDKQGKVTLASRLLPGE